LQIFSNPLLNFYLPTRLANISLDSATTKMPYNFAMNATSTWRLSWVNVSTRMKLRHSIKSKPYQNVFTMSFVALKRRRWSVSWSWIKNVPVFEIVSQIADLFSKQGQECLVDNVISIGFCFLQAIPEDLREKQEMLFKLIDGKECKWVFKKESSKLLKKISVSFSILIHQNLFQFPQCFKKI
jgi:hypothetical protein